ncbi:MAG: GAF domain-containing protein [Chloroflexi bacterium]|nr:GAF domain-containing protein [Chloroflexota bacterium]
MKYNQGEVYLPRSFRRMKTRPDLPPEDINPRLLEALASLNQISNAINHIGSAETEDHASSLQLIVESSIRVIPGSSAVIYTYDPSSGTLEIGSRVFANAAEHPPVSQARQDVDTPRPNGYGARTVSRKHRTLSYEESDLEIHPYHVALGVRVVACFPLIVAEQVVGVLYIYLYDERPLSQLEELMLDNFVNQAAMAIYHTRHLAGVKRDLAHKEDELNRLRRAGLLISSRLRLEETLESILELALEISNAQYGIFRLLDKSGEYLVTRAVSSVHLEKPLVEKLPLNGKSIMAHVARTREPVLIQDLRQEPWPGIYYPLDSKLEMRSELAVPLINASGRLEGVLNLESPRLQGFSEDDSHLLQSLATYAVTAIQEVRLLDALQEAAQLLVSQPSQKVLDQLCGMANDLLNTSASAIWLRDEAGELQLSVSNGALDAKRISPSVSDSPNALFVPLETGADAKTLGLFGVFHAVTGAGRSDKSEWDKKVLACLANYAVLAVQNESHQQALRSSQEQHLIAETFAAVGDISANLLHNMNNKVGTIPVRVQSIEDKYSELLEQDPYLANALSEIERSAMAAMQIVQENLSHLRPIRVEPVEAGLRIADAIHAIQLPEGIKIELSGIEGLPQVYANSQNLSFVFKNLIENAIEAMHAKGVIRITGSCSPAAVEIAIADSGPGIPPDLHEQIFQLEFSSRAHPGKMGFGLWWVRTWMTRLGGTVNVESDGAHGTTFRLRLPVADPEHSA